MKLHRRSILCVAAMAVTIVSGLSAAIAQVPPDLTRSNTVDRTLTHNLGATGRRGWIYTKPATFLDSVQGRTTTASRQILLTHVGEKSPAYGVTKVDDVILGADEPLSLHVSAAPEHRVEVRAMNHLATAPFNAQGFLQRYTAETGKWSEQDPVSQGQAMENFARAILAARQLGGIDTKPWEDFLRKACAIHAARILRDDWRPVSTAQAFYVSPLGKAHTLFANADFKLAALKAAEHYATRHLDMTEPYWGGTLDARCEDKEGALAGFQAFLAVYELTKEPRHLEWAAHALDVALTYTVLWDIDLPAGRLRDHGLTTRGWTIVSAQNQHLDVYAVLFTPEIWRMGEWLRRDDLKRLAALMFRSCGQLIDPYGSQGEQIQHTNLGQSGELTDVYRMRGGYSEGWTVFWITAHFLNAAAQFEAMGVDLDRISPRS